MAEEKVFGDLFANNNIKADLFNIFKNVKISDVIINRKSKTIRMKFSYDRLILKSDVISLERELSKKIMSGETLKIVINEKYSLSSQYTPAIWFDSYKDSILLELERVDKVLYNYYKASNPRIDDNNNLLISLPDTIIAKNKENELVDILDRIIHDRFGFDFTTVVKYTDPVPSKRKADNELKVKRRLDEIIASYSTNPDDAISIKDLVNADSDSVSDDLAESINTIAKDAPFIVDNDVKVVNKKTEEIAKDKNNTEAKKETNKEVKKSAPNNGYDNQGKYPKKSSYKSSFKDKPEFVRKMIKSDNPDVIYNKEFEDDIIALEDIQDEIGEATVMGQILNIDERFIEKTGKTVMKYEISDFTDSLVIKLYLSKEFADELRPLAKPGDFIKAKGIIQYDKFDRQIEMSSLFGIMKSKDFRTFRSDNATRKRVELHCHTKMSDMDAVSDIKSIIKQVKKYGHQALAVTDHGDVQAFPDANHSIDPSEDFKILYGVEGYLVDDSKLTVTNSKGQSLDESYVVFDIETTGFSPVNDKIIEIGAVKVVNSKIVERFSEFVNPKVPIPYRIEQLTSISDDMVIDAEEIDVILPKFLEFCKDSILVAHNADFDMSFIKAKSKEQGIDIDFTYVDTMGLSRAFFPTQAKHNLDVLCKNMGVSNEHHHRAVDDAEATAQIFVKFIPMLKKENCNNLDDVKEFGTLSNEAISRIHPYHVIIIAKNEIGRRNLYKLISLSHLNYYHKSPKIPKSLISIYREGLIIGSACEQGELYSAIVHNQEPAIISKIAQFYDYLEIQPIGNNIFQIKDERFPEVESVEDLKEINRKIVKLGELYGKPVCATCDVHFLNPEDGIYRQIIMTGKGFKDTDDQAPLYLRTTEEMLEEFAYLGSDKAEEVVVTNTNLIADMCDKITPVRPDKCPPVIEDSDKTLRTICYNKAHEMYGDPLPKIVEERLERELNSIIGNGFAVMYIIAQKLVWKSVEDGYLVGSRGSVGSSFVATMAGITEVNPLSPHYYCMDCSYSEFDTPDVLQYKREGLAGCDMPDKICPKCGKKMLKDGFDIPFETFLGFEGDKEPDIDLNFSGEYQSKAHKYTEVIFGYGQTFRAGTIGTLADKTAYGYVKHYYEEKGHPKRDGEINRLVQGCVGVRRTTGQHPGGIVVLPVGEDINSFTAVQHPPQDDNIITTHFDYHSIDHNLLKLDILGHDDPTMIRMLQDLTGIDPVTIPLDDKGVMSLFQSTEALGITPEDIRGVKLGSLGIPEFGTDFAMGMLIETQPKAFSDLVRIAGLSHGTDVWLGNAQVLLQEGKATISNAICTRDDIMTYLIDMGVDPGKSFKIMENVRKGKVAKGKCDKWPEWKEDMLAHNVPDWYVWSCEKIQYMFPKAHAAAYVMMAWRIAYCKINYPLAYYCAFFSIRAKAFNYEKMCLGKNHLGEELDKLEEKSKNEKLSPKEEDLIRDGKIVYEMYARGFEFTPVDLYKAKAKDFQIIDGKIMPAFSAIEGLGESCAVMIEDEAKQGKFFSKDDLKERAKVPTTVMETLTRLGILKGMPQSSQLSLFDDI